METKSFMLAGGAVVAVAVASAIYLRPLPEPVTVATTEAGGAGAGQIAEPEQAEPEAAEPVQLMATQEDAPEVEEAEPAPEPAAEEVQAVAVAPDPVEFRFEPDGAVLVMGTADPSAPVALMLDGAEVMRVQVAEDGAFLATAFLGHSDWPRILRVVGDPDGAALMAERTFVLDANPAPAPEENQTDTVALVEDPVSEDEDTSDTGEAPAPAAAEPPPPAVPAILALTDEGVEVVQPAIEVDAAPEVMSTVALDTITYDPGGDVILQGRALVDGFVQVYVDNAPVSLLPVDADGTWRGDLPDVDTGVHTLRVDEIADDGTVVSRIETPFLREDPAAVAEVMEEALEAPGVTIATRTVQPGATLWAIAEERYGAGILYVSVFEANRDRIRNPDLIYPGQVFVLPEDGN